MNYSGRKARDFNIAASATRLACQRELQANRAAMRGLA